MTSARTGLLGLLGWPVAHSLSPALHTAALDDLGLDLAYLALPVAPEALLVAVRGLVAMRFRGANVTVPHKQEVMQACDRVTDEARRIGAVNTLVPTDDGLVGENTDARGLAAALRAVEDDLDARPGLVVGTGGAARAAVVALERLGVRVVVAGRRPDAAADVAALVAGRAIDLADTAAVRTACVDAVVVNATSLGLHGESLPAVLLDLPEGSVAQDLVYNPAVTPFLAAARARGLRGHDGLGMLVEQAALSLTAWTGRDPDREVMWAAARAALGRA